MDCFPLLRESYTRAHTRQEFYLLFLFLPFYKQHPRLRSIDLLSSPLCPRFWLFWLPRVTSCLSPPIRFSLLLLRLSNIRFRLTIPPSSWLSLSLSLSLSLIAHGRRMNMNTTWLLWLDGTHLPCAVCLILYIYIRTYASGCCASVVVFSFVSF
jgi:hypothetical protein